MKRKTTKTPVKTDFTRYLTSEEGKIVKGDVVKMAAVLGIIAVVAPQEAAAHVSHGSNPTGGPNESILHNDGASGGAYHSSGPTHKSHTSHGSHGSHGQW